MGGSQALPWLFHVVVEVVISEKRSQKNKNRKVQKFGGTIFLEEWIFHCVVTQECPMGSSIETNVETVATYLSERG